MENLNSNDDFIEHGPGRAGPHEWGFVQAGYELDQIDSLRQALLSQNDMGKVQRVLRKLGILVQRDIIQAVKNYIFDSQGIAFTYPNYIAWRRLVTKKGMIGDAAFVLHEMAEVEELQRIQRETGFDFRKIDFKTVQEFNQWKHDFNQYYRQAHSQALKEEYKFVVQQITEATNGKVKISFLQAAAIDPTRYISLRTNETEAARHMFVDGMIMKEHYHYKTWCQQASETVSLSKSMQRRLGYYRKQITLQKLIMQVKNIPIN